VLPESLPKEKRLANPFTWADVTPFGPIADMLKRPTLRPLLATQSIFTFVSMGFNSIVAVYLIERYGVTPGSIAGLLVVIGIANVVVQAALVGRLVALFGEKRLAIASLLFQALANLGTVIVPTYWMMYPLYTITSGGSGTIRPALSALLANSVSMEEQGKLNGVSTALNSLMNIFGPLCAGLAYDHIAPTAPFMVGALVLVLTCLLLVRVKVSAPDPASKRRPVVSA
jgi:MFS transporter, DHA1 family, tetracycline resistance protein